MLEQDYKKITAKNSRRAVTKLCKFSSSQGAVAQVCRWYVSTAEQDTIITTCGSWNEPTIAQRDIPAPPSSPAPLHNPSIISLYNPSIISLHNPSIISDNSLSWWPYFDAIVRTRGVTWLPEFGGGVHLFILNRHNTPSGQSRVYRVTQLRTDGVHC